MAAVEPVEPLEAHFGAPRPQNIINPPEMQQQQQALPIYHARKPSVTSEKMHTTQHS